MRKQEGWRSGCRREEDKERPERERGEDERAKSDGWCGEKEKGAGRGKRNDGRNNEKGFQL